MLDSQNLKNPSPNLTNKGFTLIEVMVALVIFAFGIIAVLGMQTTAIRGGYQSRTLMEAASFGADVIERHIVRPDYVNVSNGTFKDGKYTATLNVVKEYTSGQLSNTKKLKLTVSWTEGGRTPEVVYEFFKAKDI